jgi:hypothetical protein
MQNIPYKNVCTDRLPDDESIRFEKSRRSKNLIETLIRK